MGRRRVRKRLINLKCGIEEEVNYRLDNPDLNDLCNVFEEIERFMEKSILNKKLFLINHKKQEFISLKSYMN